MKKIRLLACGLSLALLAGSASALVFHHAQAPIKTVADDEETYTPGATYTIESIMDWYGTNYVKFSFSGIKITNGGDVGKDIASYNSTDGTHTQVGNAGHKDFAGNWCTAYVGPDINAAGVAGTVTYLKLTFLDSSSDVMFHLQYGQPPAADTITVSPTSSELMVGNTLNVAANTTSTVTWSSSNTSIATVEEKQDDNKVGVVTGVATGEAVITARISETVSATCAITVINHVVTKLSTPVGVVLNQIGDGGKLVAFAPVDHASSYKAVFHGQDDSVVEAAIANGGRLDSAWTNLVSGMYYEVGIVAVGDGVNYSDSDESALASTKFLCMKSGYTYAQFFLNATNVCDYDGATFNITKTIWDELKAKYDQLFFNQRKSLKDGTTESEQDAIARYNYILTKYSETEYDWLVDFIDTGVRNPSSSNNNTVMNITNSSTTLTTIIVACLAVVSFAGVVTFSTMKKRKHQ